MAFQADSKFYTTPAGDMAVVGCYCGEVCNCGTIELKQNDDPDEEYHMWAQLSWTPRSWSWKQRWQLIWDILCGRTLDTGVSWNRPTCVSLGEWLLREPVWQPKPGREELEEKFRAIRAWTEAGAPDPETLHAFQEWLEHGGPGMTAEQFAAVQRNAEELEDS